MASGTPVNEGGRGLEASHVPARTRVLVAFAAGVVAFGAAILVASWQLAVLIGWDVSASVFIAWVWRNVGRLDGAATAIHATTEDGSRRAAEFILLASSAASLVGVALVLLEASDEEGLTRILLTAVASLTVVLSCGAVHTVFTLRYARLYHLEGGGIEFGDGRTPEYGDFAYVAFTIGMTYQVSDTALTARTIRRTALRHALLSFVFGTSVVAMLINVVAGLFSP